MTRAGLIVLLACGVWIAGCGAEPDAQPTASPAPSSPTSAPASPSPAVSPTLPAGFADPAGAIAAYLEGKGLGYAGECQEQPPATDVGKYCSTVAADRGSELVVKVGQLQSEYDTYLLVQQTDGYWLVVDSAAFPIPDDGTLPF